MTASTKWTLASVFLALSLVVIWFGAPPIPALIGAIGAGLVLYWRDRRSAR
jgi:hypothetical protein